MLDKLNAPALMEHWYGPVDRNAHDEAPGIPLTKRLALLATMLFGPLRVRASSWRSASRKK